MKSHFLFVRLIISIAEVPFANLLLVYRLFLLPHLLFTPRRGVQALPAGAQRTPSNR
jgi:hypothetical protein